MQLDLVLLVLLVTSTTFCNGQFFYHQQLAPVSQPYAHPSVVENSVHEAQLPPELSKSSRFYKNPHIAAALAKESWFTDKEMPVLDREAEKIPRDMVYKLFKNAGYIKRR
ncbi:uncharacterized protein LOC135955986 [Calliphora vicina]|uniref:uncharacterized protein LOC135955986 n=1 Tax=Calliphora vicina TaxID=7373 RepID=UPI00325A4EDD